MRVIGLLSWFDELPSMLADCVASMGEAGIDHVVAVDGPYKLFPGTLPCSAQEQHHTITSVAQQYGMGVTIHVPGGAWENNEIEKRSTLFDLGHALAVPSEDWLFVLDADEVISDPGDYRAVLARTSNVVCAVTHLDSKRPPTWERRFFRAHPRGIRVERAHWLYVNGDRDVLWGPGQIDRHLTSMVVDHRWPNRTRERTRRRNEYYERRHEAQVEVEF